MQIDLVGVSWSVEQEVFVWKLRCFRKPAGSFVKNSMCIAKTTASKSEESITVQLHSQSTLLTLQSYVEHV